MIIKQLSLIIEIKIQVPENLHTMNNEQIGNVFFEILRKKHSYYTRFNRSIEKRRLFA